MQSWRPPAPRHRTLRPAPRAPPLRAHSVTSGTCRLLPPVSPFRTARHRRGRVTRLSSRAFLSLVWAGPTFDPVPLFHLFMLYVSAPPATWPTQGVAHDHYLACPRMRQPHPAHCRLSPCPLRWCPGPRPRHMLRPPPCVVPKMSFLQWPESYKVLRRLVPRPSLCFSVKRVGSSTQPETRPLAPGVAGMRAKRPPRAHFRFPTMSPCPLSPEQTPRSLYP